MTASGGSLRIEGLRKAFAAPVLRGVDLTVQPGSLVAILGQSGSGKTTLLRLLSGFERADAGRIQVGERVLAAPGLHVPPEQRRIGYVAQEGALFPHLSVADNIVFGLNRRERRARHRVAALLELVGLPEAYAARAPQQLSGGEQQRVALARALAPGPGLVLLDEPFSSLDAALRVETREAVAAALAAAGATALLVTHDQSEALAMGHAVAVLREGSLIQVADPQTLYRHPADPALARFVGDAVLLSGTALAGSVGCALGRLRLAPHLPAAVQSGPVQVLVRPEQIRLGARHDPGVPAQVSGVTFYGHDASVRLKLLDGGVEAVSARVSGHLAPHVGDAVTLSVEGAVVAYPRAAAAAPSIARRSADLVGR